MKVRYVVLIVVMLVAVFGVGIADTRIHWIEGLQAPGGDGGDGGVSRSTDAVHAAFGEYDCTGYAVNVMPPASADGCPGTAGSAGQNPGATSDEELSRNCLEHPMHSFNSHVGTGGAGGGAGNGGPGGSDAYNCPSIHVFGWTPSFRNVGVAGAGGYGGNGGNGGGGHGWGGGGGGGGGAGGAGLSGRTGGHGQIGEDGGLGTTIELVNYGGNGGVAGLDNSDSAQHTYGGGGGGAGGGGAGGCAYAFYDGTNATCGSNSEDSANYIGWRVEALGGGGGAGGDAGEGGYGWYRGGNGGNGGAGGAGGAALAITAGIGTAYAAGGNGGDCGYGGGGGGCIDETFQDTVMEGPFPWTYEYYLGIPGRGGCDGWGGAAGQFKSHDSSGTASGAASEGAPRAKGTSTEQYSSFARATGARCAFSEWQNDEHHTSYPGY